MKSLEIVLSLVLNHFLFRDWLVGNKNNIWKWAQRYHLNNGGLLLCCTSILPSGTCVRSREDVAFIDLECLQKTRLLCFNYLWSHLPFVVFRFILVQTGRVSSHPQWTSVPKQIWGKIHEYKYQLSLSPPKYPKCVMLQNGNVLCIDMVPHIMPSCSRLPSTYCVFMLIHNGRK